MTTFSSFLKPTAERIHGWLHGAPKQEQKQEREAVPTKAATPVPESRPGHAPGHRHLGPPARVPFPKDAAAHAQQHHPAWLSPGGRVDRLRRNERHGDESKT